MRNLTFKSLLILFTFVYSNSYAQYSGGDGSPGTPFVISTYSDLLELSGTPAHWNLNFVQSTNIDGSVEVNPEGFMPIGNASTHFSGNYDGGGFEISSLTINRPGQDDVALFGVVGATGAITNLELTNANVTGQNRVGALVGHNFGSVSVSGASTVSVSGTANDVGGLVGNNQGGISSSYVNGTSEGVTNVGGFIGRNNGSVLNSFSRTNASGSTRVGGFIGLNNPAATIENSYSTGSSNLGFGGFIFTNQASPANVQGCFWNTQTSGIAGSNGGTGINNSEMQNISTFTAASWDFVSNWVISGVFNAGFPYLNWMNATSSYSGGSGTAGDPFVILTISDLVALSLSESDWASSFVMASDIDASSTDDGDLGFSPIGTESTPFTGSFDGSGYTITDLYINRSSSNIGLFGVVSGSVSDVVIEDAQITGGLNTGGIVGHLMNGGTIENTGVVLGAISASGNNTGGLVGLNDGLVSKSYSTGQVSGQTNVGGAIGRNNGEITISFSTSNVNGNIRVAGLVGLNTSSAVISETYSTGVSSSGAGLVLTNQSAANTTRSFYNEQSSQATFSNGGVALNNSEMQDVETFINESWDFNSDWTIDGVNNGGFPYLSWITSFPQFSYSGGEGTQSNPYLISNTDDLLELSQTSADWSSYFVLTDDIDAVSLIGFTPIGNTSTNFNGVFDGQEFAISNLSIDLPASNNVGLFGVTGSQSEISNLTLVNASVNGDARVGSLIGQNFGSVSKSGTVDAQVNASGNTGALIGENRGLISEVYSSGSVSSESEGAGGLVGNNTSTGEILNSYSRAVVTGSVRAAGLVATNTGAINNCYSSGLVQGASQSTLLRGLVATNSNLGATTNSFWNIETSGIVNTAGGGTGITSALMETQSSFTDAGWDFGATWAISASLNSGFPYLQWMTIFPKYAGGEGTSSNPYRIASLADLIQLSQNSDDWSSHFRMEADIDASSTFTSGFTPIGSTNSLFSGNFDGNNHRIINLHISLAGQTNVGLFGATSGAAEISNLGLIGENFINGGTNVGSLVGINAGSLESCYSSIRVSGGSHIGGLVGRNNGTITGSYATGNVNASNQNAGGLVGINNGDIIRSYAQGFASAPTRPAGLVAVHSSGTITECYSTGGNSNGSNGGLIASRQGTVSNSVWDTDRSKVLNSSGGTPFNGDQMRSSLEFDNLGWDLSNWNLSSAYENEGYPMLSITNLNTVIWTGTEDSDWENPNNWSTGEVPTPYNDITIPQVGTVYPIVNSFTTHNRIAIQGSLTVSGDINAEHNSVISIDAGAALVQEVGSGLDGSGHFVLRVLAEGTIAGSGGRQMLIGAPMTDVTTGDVNAAGSNRFWFFNETAHQWQEVTNNNTSLDGRALLARTDGEVTFSFVSRAENTRNGEYILSGLTRTGTENNNRGYHNISNPYPSYLDWNMVVKNDVSNVFRVREYDFVAGVNVADFYNAVSGVGTNNSGNGPVSRYIAPGMGFEIQVLGDGNVGSLEFDNSMRTPISLLLPGNNKEIVRVRLAEQGELAYDETVIFSDFDASNTLDEMDTPKEIIDNQVQLFSTVNGEKFVMSAFNSLTEQQVVKLGYIVPTAGSYTIFLGENTVNVPMYLVDNKENVVIDLSEDDVYTFTTDETKDNNRFEIHFGQVLSVDEFSNDDLSIYSVGDKTIRVDVKDATLTKMDNVVIYNLSGAVVYSSQLAENVSDIKVNVPNGMYIVKVTVAGEVKNQKIIL